MTNDEQYLGDGVFAEFDGYQIRLRAPREIGDHVIYVEPDVFRALQHYAARHWPQLMEKEN